MINNKWFTVVELVVAVMIIAILWTVGFIQFSSFIASSRDTNRISQVAELYDGFVWMKMRWTLPMPSGYIEIKKWDKLVSYQWHVWERLLDSMEYTSKWRDPETGDFYTYSLSKNKKSIAIMALLEEDPILKNYVTHNNVYADWEEFKYPYVEWKKVGIIIDNDNIPVDRIQANRTAGEFNLYTANDQYRLFLANDEIYSGTGGSLINASKDYSCKRIKDLDPWTENWIYPLDTDGDGILSSNYCNMQIEWWGWTLVLKANGEETTFEYDSPLWENTATYNLADYKYDDKEYKNGQFSNLPFKQVMLELKTWTKTRYIIAAIKADSLYELFNAWYTPTYLTREIWKTMIEDSSLQLSCNKEWFNVRGTSNSHAKTRFWIISNQENECDTPDSKIWIWNWSQTPITVWNYAGPWSPDNWTKDVSSFGYLYVR